MTTPLVTVCVPTYQGAEWLAECLASAAAQTYKNLQILVVDDASTDETVAVAREFASGDARVEIEQNPQRLGLAANWNRAVEIARGEWIKFLFQDDLLAPTCVEKMVAAGSEERPLVVCDRGLLGGSPKELDYFAKLPRLSDLCPGEADSAAVSKALAAHPGVNFLGEPSAVMLHRSAFARFGLFNCTMIQLCDLELFARVGSSVGLVHVAEELASFRLHAKSASAANLAASQFRKDVLDTLILLHEYAYDNAFAELRDVAKRSSPPVKFAQLAARELLRAIRDAKASSDPSLPAALDEVVSIYPRLARPWWRLWHRVLKTLGASS